MQTSLVLLYSFLNPLRARTFREDAIIFATSSGHPHASQVYQPFETATFVFALIVAAFFSWAVYKALRARSFKVKTGREALLGSVGTAVTDLSPNGEVRVLSEFWRARAKNGNIRRSTHVVVVDMDGLVLIVKPVEEKA